MTDAPALSGLEIPGENAWIPGGYGQGPTETEIRAAIQEIELKAPLTGARRAVKQMAISLAISIDKGNAKGRAIANEAGQLFDLMQHLAPADDGDAGESNLTDETQKLLAAYAAPAQPHAAP